MAPRDSLTREDAARLLGVGADAGPADGKRAFRLSAAWTHPDQGGSAQRSTELCAARDRLLAECESPRPVRADTPLVPRPRKPWRSVLVRPTPRGAVGLAIGFAVAVATVLLAGAAPLLALPAAFASAAWCVAVSRGVLRAADHGHVIVTRSLAWGAVTCAQVGIAMLVGIELIEVLPLLAVPFVAAIAMVNPAPGLWQGARG